MVQHDKDSTPQAAGRVPQAAADGNKSAGGEGGQRLEGATGPATEAAKGEFERLKQDAEQLASHAKEQASETVAAVGSMARRAAEQQKNAGADRIEGVAKAINRVAGELDKEMPGAGGYARKAAADVERFSSSLRDRSVGDLLNNINSFARSQPLAFFGASVLAGLALSRFLMSSAERRDERDRPAGSQASSASGAGSSYGAPAPGTFHAQDRRL